MPELFVELLSFRAGILCNRIWTASTETIDVIVRDCDAQIKIAQIIAIAYCQTTGKPRCHKAFIRTQGCNNMLEKSFAIGSVHRYCVNHKFLPNENLLISAICVILPYGLCIDPRLFVC